MSTTISSLEASKKQLLADLRGYVSSQKELWQQVPSLALEADGRTGFSDINGHAWQSGYWPIYITGASSQGYVALIDLSSAEIVNSLNPKKKPRDMDLLIILSDLSVVNAEKIITDLKEATTMQYFKSFDPKTQEAWRSEMRSKHNIQTIFVRQ